VAKLPDDIVEATPSLGEAKVVDPERSISQECQIIIHSPAGLCAREAAVMLDADQFPPLETRSAKELGSAAVVASMNEVAVVVTLPMLHLCPSVSAPR
jgi:hypothetical protein